MTPITKILLITGSVTIIVALTATASYYAFQIHKLSLPIPQLYAYSALALPFITTLATILMHRFRLTLPHISSRRKLLRFLGIFILQTIYETVIAVLAVFYMRPSCSFEEQWKALYTSKDALAIRRVQNQFECCGFNTVVDRAWPFPHGRPDEGFGADQCKRMFKRDRACGEVWRGVQVKGAGVFFGLAGSVLIFMILVLIIQIYNIKERNSPGWMRFFGRLRNGEINNESLDNNEVNRRSISQGGSVTEHEAYSDNVTTGSQRRTVSPENSNMSGGRVEPSALAADNSSHSWNDIV